MMGTARNVLFIMCDQLRADYLSCYGNETITTPSIDSLASMGTRYTRAYAQSPVCGPSRMSFYTGRYVLSHGATWNFVPLPVGERTLGDFLRPLGIRVAVVGKTHAVPDAEGLRRVGLSASEGAGRFIAEAGFEPYARDDGLHPDDRTPTGLPYNEYLRRHGMDAKNPWHDWANSGLDAQGNVASGWYLRNAHLSARVPDEHSESAYTTDRAIDFIREQGERRWLLHVSYIKPHWPYIVSTPYHNLFGKADIRAPCRSPLEQESRNPVYAAFQAHKESRTFAQEEPRLNAVRAYMGLIRQVDHHIGRLLACLAETGRLEDTLIAFTSDHGDFLGDHWLGEKEFMYEQSVRIPLIVVPPGAQPGDAGICTDLVEAIDVVPTFLEALGAAAYSHIVEGRSLLSPQRPRVAVISELDYSVYPAARNLHLTVNEARMVMVRTECWKLIHFGRSLPPQLFDLESDLAESNDLGTAPGLEKVRRALYDHLIDFTQGRRNRIAMDDHRAAGRQGPGAAGGVTIGEW